MATAVFEECLLHLELPTIAHARNETLTVFRRGPTLYRIVREVDATQPGGREVREREITYINTHDDRLIPWYALPAPPHGAPTQGLKICNGNGTASTMYELRGTADALAFQRALTGYEIPLDIAAAAWTASHPVAKVWSEMSRGQGRVQIWRWKPLQAMHDAASPLLGSPNRSSRTFSVGSSTSTVARAVAGLDDRAMSLVSTTQHRGLDTLTLAAPAKPMIVVYTVLDNKHSFMALEKTAANIVAVARGLKIVPTSCKCANSYDTCLSVVIESRPDNHQAPFTLQSMSAASVDAWNLALFASPRPPRSSEHIKSTKCNYFRLKFPSIGEKSDFIRCFKVAAWWQTREEADYYTALSSLRTRGEGTLNQASSSSSASSPQSTSFGRHSSSESSMTLKPADSRPDSYRLRPPSVSSDFSSTPDTLKAAVLPAEPVEMPAHRDAVELDSTPVLPVELDSLAIESPTGADVPREWIGRNGERLHRGNTRPPRYSRIVDSGG